MGAWGGRQRWVLRGPAALGVGGSRRGRWLGHGAVEGRPSGEGDNEGDPAGRLVFGPDTATVRLDDAAGDVEAEPGAFGRDLLIRQAHVWLEDRFQAVVGNARPLIDHPQLNAIAEVAQPHA